jgi:hypothetical protein
MRLLRFTLLSALSNYCDITIATAIRFVTTSRYIKGLAKLLNPFFFILPHSFNWEKYRIGSIFS